MKILGILNEPWMIDQNTLSEITAKYMSHLKGEKIDFKALMGDNQQRSPGFEKVGAIAIIKIHGILTPGISFFSFFFDEAGTKSIENNIKAALDDPEIEKILLDMDTPGGSVKGTFELADFIFEASKEKPIITWSGGTIASGGMLLAAATDEIYITGKTNQVGSIGVIARKYDFTKYEENEGLIVEEFVTGQYKNVGSPHKKTTDADRKEIQSQVDAIFTPMVNDISARRGLNPREIVDMQAKVFIGQQAIERGLVDGVSTIDALLSEMSGETSIFSNNPNQQVKMDLDELKTKHPELVEQIENSAISGVSSQVTAAAKKERERIAGITEACFPGQEALRDELIADGKTTPGEAAMRFNAAEKQTRVMAGKEIDRSMPTPAVSAEPKAKNPDKKPEPKTLKEKFEASKELQAAFYNDYDTYEAYMDANENGQVKILKKEAD